MSMTISVEIEQFYVTPSWVANHYGVTKLAVYRAIAARKLVAAKVRGAGQNSLVLDSRTLPSEFPR